MIVELEVAVLADLVEVAGVVAEAVFYVVPGVIEAKVEARRENVAPANPVDLNGPAPRTELSLWNETDQTDGERRKRRRNQNEIKTGIRTVKGNLKTVTEIVRTKEKKMELNQKIRFP